MRCQFRVSAIVLVAAAAVVCSSALAGKKEVKPDTTFLTLNCKFPNPDTLPGYPWEQTHGNVTMRLAPISFKSEILYRKTFVEKPNTSLFKIGVGSAKNYIETEEPIGINWAPDTLKFQLHLMNNFNYVLRLQGCLVSLLIDGKSQPIDESTQAKFHEAIILPHQTMDLTICGPRLSTGEHLSYNDTLATILDTAKVIMFSIYDVTTEVDKANNPAAKSTFEWIFENKPFVRTHQVTKIVSETKLEPADAARISRETYVK